MRAAIYRTLDVPLDIVSVPDPEPQPDQVVLQIAHAGICGSDLHMKQYGHAAPGTIFGHEFAGTIVAKGSDVGAAWTTGERVTALPIIACRHCEACDADLPGLCRSIGFIGTPARPGAYAQYVAVRGDMIQRLPEGVSFAEGAMVEPLAVAHHAVERAEIRSGQSALVIGAGPIGIGVVLFARIKGARHVVVSEKSPERRALALEMGATAVIDPTVEDVAARFAALAGGRPETVFECVGVPGLIQQAIGLAGVRGQVVVAGVCFGEDKIAPITALMPELTIKFSQCYTEDDFAAVIDAVAMGRAQVRPMHTRTVGFGDFPAAFDALGRSPTDCKILLDPDRVTP
jgi:(R,R)-butanediol dehydrogenase/meso-butanediol dehydrogenase/diacetyl reductase